MSSSINPNNIDGQYPIAGQDNDSQGFRDNFTNIKNNLTFAKAELEDLQNNAILKTPLAGTTLNNDMNQAQLKEVQCLAFTETTNDLGAVPGALPNPVEVDWRLAHFQTMSTTGNVELSFTGWPASGLYAKFRLEANVTSTSHTIKLPTEVTVGSGSLQGLGANNTVTFDSVGMHLFEFSTHDAGTIVTVQDLLRNYENVDSGANLLIKSSTSAVGYTTGAGNVVTQATSKSTAVTLNAPTGRITANTASLSNGANVGFVFNNSSIDSSDVLIVNISGNATPGAYQVQVEAVANGSANIRLYNVGSTSLSEAVNLNYAVIKGSTN